MSMTELIQYASFTAGAWRRRAQVRRELGLVAAIRRLPTLQAALVPWSAACLRCRAPTTTISYWHVAVAEVAGGTKSLSTIQRQWYRGLVVLYGTASWYERAEPMTMQTARSIVDNPSLPEWFRVIIDVAWHAVGRIADLQYLTPNDVDVDDQARTVTAYFTFLKNTIDGSLGSVKTLSLWRHEAMTGYIRTRQHEAQLFPQTAADVNRLLSGTTGHTSRDIRRGGALLLTTGGAHEDDIALALAHRSTATQRTYTQMGNVHAQRRTAYMQVLLSGHAPPGPPSTAIMSPAPTLTTGRRRGVMRTTTIPQAATPAPEATIERIGVALPQMPTPMVTTPRSPTEDIGEWIGAVDEALLEAALRAAMPDQLAD